MKRIGLKLSSTLAAAAAGRGLAMVHPARSMAQATGTPAFTAT